MSKTSRTLVALAAAAIALVIAAWFDNTVLADAQPQTRSTLPGRRGDRADRARVAVRRRVGAAARGAGMTVGIGTTASPRRRGRLLRRPCRALAGPRPDDGRALPEALAVAIREIVFTTMASLNAVGSIGRGHRSPASPRSTVVARTMPWLRAASRSRTPRLIRRSELGPGRRLQHTRPLPRYSPGVSLSCYDRRSALPWRRRDEPPAATLREGTPGDDRPDPEDPETSGPNGGSPAPVDPAFTFGGLAIDFSSDTGAVPLRRGGHADRLRRGGCRSRPPGPAGRSAVAAHGGRTEAKVVIVGSGPPV